MLASFTRTKQSVPPQHRHKRQKNKFTELLLFCILMFNLCPFRKKTKILQIWTSKLQRKRKFPSPKLATKKNNSSSPESPQYLLFYLMFGTSFKKTNHLAKQIQDRSQKGPCGRCWSVTKKYCIYIYIVRSIVEISSDISGSN